MKQFFKQIYRVVVAAAVLLIFFSGGMKAQDVSATLLSGDSFKYPWAGGMNSMQFGELDINRDGIKDLVAFDRQGNRIMPFLNGDAENTVDYSYAPEYIDDFPELFDWAIFADYDNDGKNDIFTYSPGWAGMMVYKNVSGQKLKFKRVVYPYLTSLNSGGEVNILVTYADYPGIADLDGDGDLDILTFWGLGSFVEMHKNLSMETYGNADSLIFEKTEDCWGHFAESDESNELFLDTCISQGFGEVNNFVQRKDRHTGSTFLLLDLDADNDKDLLLGDVDYPGLFALINGGTKDNALITSFDTLFPRESSAIRIFSMPAAAYIDVNNDGIKDLIVSPFDPNPFISKNFNSNMLYINKGENNHPDFQYEPFAFLQPDMIDVGSGAMPVFYDWDGDGLTDLFIGNYGYYGGSWYDEHYTLHSRFTATVAFFKNVGTAETPVFKGVDMNFGGFFMEDEKFVGVAPAFGDIDGDGDVDMITGNSEGTLLFYENSDLGMERKSTNYFSIDVGEFSTPQLFDLDRDGLLDLIIGEKDGNLNYYHNEGNTAEPDFVFVTDSLGKVNVTDYSVSWAGYSIPWFYVTPENVTRLVVGSEQGKLFYFENIDDNLTGKFTESDNLKDLIGLEHFNVDRGMRTAATLCDIDNDGQPEMIAGNLSGGVELFGGAAQVIIGVGEKAEDNRMLTVFPNPTNGNVEIVLPEKLAAFMVEVFDLSGKVVYKKGYGQLKTSKVSLNLSGLKAGVYIINLTDSKHLFTGKIVVKP